MPNCDFYALGSDLVGVLDFIFEQPDWSLIELASRHEEKLRQFRSMQSFVEAFPDFAKLKSSLHFQLYSPEMGAKWQSRRINFNPGVGAKFRYDCEGWGLIQLYLGALRKGRLENCHTNHNSAQRARTWERSASGMGAAGAWDFAAVTSMSSRLNRFIRKSSVAKNGARPILRAAQAAFQAGAFTLA